MYISDFIYHKPSTLKEALGLMNVNDDVAILAGGTDLLVEIKKGLRHHKNLISIVDIDELRFVKEENNEIIIGAGMTHNDIIKNQFITQKLPALADALSKVGSEQVRNSGTIGGNLCTGASCCDSAPLLIALHAKVEILGTTGVRIVPLKDFFVFNKKTKLEKGEILTKVIIPIPVSGTGLHYEKFGLREAAAVSVVSVAVMVLIENNICMKARVVIGAVAPTPKISEKATAIIVGKNVSQLTLPSEILDQAGDAAAEDSIPIDDIRGGAKYRKQILSVLTKRAIEKAVASVKK
jgi:carbon-monoxide dehydrogenase medium subunit